MFFRASRAARILGGGHRRILLAAALALAFPPTPGGQHRDSTPDSSRQSPVSIWGVALFSVFRKIFAAALPRVRNSWLLLMWWSCAAVALSACGGGGGGSPAASPAPDIAITAQPTDLTTVDGVGVIFSVDVSGWADFRWQRLQGGTWTDIGGNGPSVSTGMVSQSDSGTQYRVIVSSRSNPAYTITSSVVTLTVGPVVLPPVVEVQPKDIVLNDGQAGSLAVTVGGTGLSYEWQQSTDGVAWSPVAGAAAATLTLPAATLADDGRRYRVVVTNSGGSATSNAARVTVTAGVAAPVFTMYPQSVNVVLGQSATFAAAALGQPAPTLQWQHSGDGGNTWTPVVGQTGGSYTVHSTTLTDAGRWIRVVATNPSGSVNSAVAVLGVAPQPASPTIQSGPADVSIGTGGYAHLRVEAGGWPSVTYQWQVSNDGGTTFSNVNGATLPSYVTPSLTRADDLKRFRVVVSNTAGTATSDAALLRVMDGPAVTLHPTEQGWRPGQTDALFTIAATGDALQYQWQASSDGVTFADVEGATGASYIHAAGASASVKAVRAVVRNGVGTSTTFPATLSALHWRHTNPRPTGDALAGVAWVDATTLVAVGDARTVLRSTDSGATWSIVSENAWTNSRLRAVSFNGSGAGVAVGEFGTTKRSIDGGLHWVVVQNTGNNRTLSGVAHASATHVIAVGGQGTVLRSTDNGATWTAAVSDAAATDLSDVVFSADGIGLAVGSNGTILRSINGGANWGVVRTGGLSLAAVAFASAEVAIAAGEGGTMLRSTDAGKTWVPVTSATPFWIASVHFGNESAGAATTSQGSIVHTTDGGATWTQASPVLSHSYGTVRFGSPTMAVAVGVHGMIRRSVDGGATWTSVTTGPTAGMAGVAFASAQIGVAVGHFGTMMRTTDAGASWTELPAAPEQLHGVGFADASVGVAVGYNGTVLRTTDAGATWNPVASGTTKWLSAVSFPSPGIGVIATDNGLLRSVDAGASWTPAAGGQHSLTAVAFGSPLVGVAVGGSGVIVRTVDGGQNWATVASGVTDALLSVSFASPTTVVAVGSEGSYLRSTDGGLTWTRGSLPYGYWMYGVRFRDANVGIAVGNFSTILRTTDGGATWWSDGSQKHATLNAVTFAGPGNAVAVGSGGVVLRNATFPE